MVISEGAFGRFFSRCIRFGSFCDMETSTSNDLPPCPGPKLHKFEYDRSPIQWVERLDDGSGADGYVFRVNILEKQYAIKVFKFHNPQGDLGFCKSLLGEDVALQTVVYFTDPFFAECRAYGQIKSAIEKRKLQAGITVPCHGYMFLGEADERILSDLGVNLGLDDVNIEFQKTAKGGCRPRAIVKDFVPGESGVDEKSARRVLKGIRALHRCKIYNRDIRIDNFRNGQLVDFGSSWTEPHALLAALGRRDVEDQKACDMAMFDDMIREEGVITDQRGLPNPEYCMKLRSWDNEI